MVKTKRGLTAEQIAGAAWRRYLDRRDKTDRFGRPLVGVWDEYLKELEDAGVVATLAGYKFKE